MGRKTLYGNTPDQQEIDLFELLIFYMGRLPLLIAAAICGALLSGLITHFCIADKYTAVSRMYMVSASTSSVINLSDLDIGTSLSNDYVELMKTRPVVEGVIDSLGLDYTYDNLVGMISLSVVPNTRIVKISVTSTDPREAMDIANEMARISRVHLPKVMSAPAPTIVEEAILPKNKSYPSMSRNVAAGTMAALFAVMGVLTVIFLMDDTIRTSEDIEKEFGIMPMTVIPEGTVEGLEKRDDSDVVTRFRIPGLPMRKRRKEEYISSWTYTNPARTAEKQAVPAYEHTPLPMRQGESESWSLPYPEAQPVKSADYAEPAAGSGFGSPAVEVVSSLDPAFAAAKVVSSTESVSETMAANAAAFTEPEVASEPVAGQAVSAVESASASEPTVTSGSAAVQAGTDAIISAEPESVSAAAFTEPEVTSESAVTSGPAAAEAVSAAESLSASESAVTSGPAAAEAVSAAESASVSGPAVTSGPAAAEAVSAAESAYAAEADDSPAQPAWEIRQVRGSGRSGPTMLELRPAVRDNGRSASQQRPAYESGHSGRRPPAYYSNGLSASRRYRRRRQQKRDFAIGMACLAGAVFLSGLMISQAVFPSAPAQVSETAAQDAPAAPAADPNALPQGTGAAGSNYARVLVYLDSMQRVIEERYVAQDGTVVMNEKGYAILRNQYDANGNLTRTSYYDDNNNPVFVRELGYSSVSITYDQLGNKVGENYYDTDGSLLTGP
ncbi:MAG: Wzz/FepE/Etk N-terminal domain-containing protein [Eubacteriales bacterium]|nr:Wzz/FepE/Etk N-terminal domain-containing protein [Eubacteriales bacterium]